MCVYEDDPGCVYPWYNSIRQVHYVEIKHKLALRVNTVPNLPPSLSASLPSAPHSSIPVWRAFATVTCTVLSANPCLTNPPHPALPTTPSAAHFTKFNQPHPAIQPATVTCAVLRASMLRAFCSGHRPRGRCRSPELVRGPFTHSGFLPAAPSPPARLSTCPLCLLVRRLTHTLHPAWPCKHVLGAGQVQLRASAPRRRRACAVAAAAVPPNSHLPKGSWQRHDRRGLAVSKGCRGWWRGLGQLGGGGHSKRGCRGMCGPLGGMLCGRGRRQGCLFGGCACWLQCRSFWRGGSWLQGHAHERSTPYCLLPYLHGLRSWACREGTRRHVVCRCCC